MRNWYANAAYGSYLEHSFRYYEMDAPVISDGAFDQLCRCVLEQWDDCTHRYKSLTDVNALQAGTGFQLVGKLHPKMEALYRHYSDQPLWKVFDTMMFADKFEAQAHDVICMVKYGSIGGSVRKEDVVRIGDYLRGEPLKRKVVLPSLPPVKATVVLPPL